MHTSQNNSSSALIMLHQLLKGRQLSEDLASLYLSVDLTDFGVTQQDKIKALAVLTQSTTYPTE